ncbi:septum site-determining protein MinC [Syntrophomonas palmitatica]|uniref:septum site-determining protein MinC n=1 Tax=Syntrophomonas palmitatica TaxID=402877 RepID=UPI000AB2F602
MSPATMVNGDLSIDLSQFQRFPDILQGLIERLDIEGNYQLGSRVSIKLGDRHLSSKQVREIEDVLLDHGLYLKELMSNGPPFRAPDDPGEESPFDEMPYYNDTALVCRHLRSGQKIFTEGNLVILGDVNPGAEVVAGGNILVMGSLRGMVHAGAFGDEKALISAYRFNPTQVRIANHITRPPDGMFVEVDCPELARIRAGKVVIEKLKL